MKAFILVLALVGLPLTLQADLPITLTETTEAIHILSDENVKDKTVEGSDILNICEFMEAVSKSTDPTGKGLTFKLNDDLKNAKGFTEKTKSFNFKSLLNAVDNVCYFFDVEYEIDGHSITFKPRRN